MTFIQKFRYSEIGSPSLTEGFRLDGYTEMRISQITSPYDYRRALYFGRELRAATTGVRRDWLSAEARFYLAIAEAHDRGENAPTLAERLAAFRAAKEDWD